MEQNLWKRRMRLLDQYARLQGIWERLRRFPDPDLFRDALNIERDLQDMDREIDTVMLDVERIRRRVEKL